MAKSDLTMLFIYGTLMRGNVRAPLLDGQTYLGDVRTAAFYKLFDTGDYPALVVAAPLGQVGISILGELWEVDRACLHRLDIEEGIDEGLYERRPIALIGDTSSAESYFYLHRVNGMAALGDRWRIKR